MDTGFIERLGFFGLAATALVGLMSSPAQALYLSRVEVLQPETPLSATDFGSVVAGKYNNPAGPIAVTARGAAASPFDTPGLPGVYVFAPRPEGGWFERSLYMYIPEERGFGETLAITPQNLFVGIPAAAGDDGYVTMYEHAPGLVSGFEPPELVAALKPESAGNEEFFGTDMDWRADVLAISAPGSENVEQQKIYVYRLVNGAWQLQQVIREPPTLLGDRGRTLSTDGHRVAATGRNGSALVYVDTPAGWVLEQQFDRTSFAGAEVSGAIGIDGRWLAISTPGAIHMFLRGDSAWEEIQTIPSPTDHKLIVRDNRMLVGIPSENRAVIYRFVNGFWQQEQILVSNGAAPSERFGRAVDFGLDLAIVGAQGAVYVYRSEVDLLASLDVGPFDANGVFELGVQITNNDTDITATDTHAYVTLPNSLTLVGTPSNCNGKRAPVVVCDLGRTQNNGGTTEVTLRLRAVASGSAVIQVRVDSAQPDANLINNASEAQVNIPADVVSRSGTGAMSDNGGSGGGGAMATFFLLLLASIAAIRARMDSAKAAKT